MVRSTFISVSGSSFRTYVTDAFGSVNDCYARQVLDLGYIELLVVQTERYEACEKEEKGKA